MVVSPLEMVVIAVVVLVFLVYGPKKIPELARSIGLARKEFNQVSANPSSIIIEDAPATTSVAAPTQPSSTSSLDSVASKLGIETRGKTSQQVSEEIVRRVGSGTAPRPAS